MTSASLLNLVLYLPALAALVLALLPKEQREWMKWGAFGASALTFILSLALLSEFNSNDNATVQALTEIPWIPQLGIQYKTGIDGISLVLVLLTTLLSAISILSSFDAIRERVKEYYIFLLLLETGMIGVFVSLDLILFYVFWEAMLIPMYFLIGIWGGPRKLYATFKFVLYTLVGSLLMLVAIIWIYMRSSQGGQPGTFDLVRLTDASGPLAMSAVMHPQERLWLFLAFASAFAIKVPMWPFHTWLPDAHVEAPTAGSVILAGVLLKMGLYGFLRYCIPLFPDVALKVAPWFLALAVIGIIYGALVAYVQQDVKRLVAYSSVSHLGFCVLGLFAFTREGVQGSVLQMINHGISTGALFLIVGMIYERRHTREISAFGGLWKVIPVFAVMFLITMLSSVGLPGLNGFVGEFLILLGTWGPPGGPNNQVAAALGATGVILGAVYMLWMFQRVMQGPLDRPENQRLLDLNVREIATLLPLVLLMFWIGAAPNATLRMFDQAIYRTVVLPIESARAQTAPPRTEIAPPPSGAPGAGLPPSLSQPALSSPAAPGNHP
jgi:NADH-quinone oxidoreductase subunit M